MLTSKTSYDLSDWNGTNNTNKHKCRGTPGKVNFPWDKAFPWPELLTVFLKSNVSNILSSSNASLRYIPFGSMLSLEWSTLDAALSWYSLFTSWACEVEQKSQGAEWSYLRASQPGPPHPTFQPCFLTFQASLDTLYSWTTDSLSPQPALCQLPSWPPCVLGWASLISQVGPCPSNKRRPRTFSGICFSPNMLNLLSLHFMVHLLLCLSLLLCQADNCCGDSVTLFLQFSFHQTALFFPFSHRPFCWINFVSVDIPTMSKNLLSNRPRELTLHPVCVLCLRQN